MSELRPNNLEFINTVALYNGIFSFERKHIKIQNGLSLNIQLHL